MLMAAIGMGLGSLCVFAPPEHRDLCHAAARVLGVLLGSP